MQHKYIMVSIFILYFCMTCTRKCVCVCVPVSYYWDIFFVEIKLSKANMFVGVKQNAMAAKNFWNTILEETLNDRCLLPILKDEEHIVSVLEKKLNYTFARTEVLQKKI